MLDHATSEIASGSNLGIDATKKLPGEGFKRPWPPLIKMDAAVKERVGEILRGARVPLFFFFSNWFLAFDQKTTTKLPSGRAKAVAWLEGGTPGASPFAPMGWSSAP